MPAELDNEENAGIGDEDLPGFAGQLENGAIMRVVVSYDEEEAL